MAKIENLYGLVLAGGRSRRMGRDKATLVYRGKLQVDRAVQLLRPFCEQVFVSVRSDQDNPTTDGTEMIVDRFGEIGPIGGLLSGFYYHRDADFLVLSCAMPFVEFSTINGLIEQRNREAVATVYVAGAGRPEALCGIYENGYKDIFLQEAKSGERDLSDILLRQASHLVPIEDPSILDTVDDGNEYYDAQRRIIGV